MSADEALALSEEEQAELDLAVICGLTRRFGPYPQDVAVMPTWRRRAMRMLPRRHRWRLSYLAPDIRRFEKSRCHTCGVPSGISSGGDDV